MLRRLLQRQQLWGQCRIAAGARAQTVDEIRFVPVPDLPLAFPSLVVASSDDPYSSLEHAHAAATRWGSRWHNLGPCGHINGDSGLGDWPQGRALLDSLLR